MRLTYRLYIIPFSSSFLSYRIYKIKYQPTMSLLTYQGKLLNNNGHLVAKFTPAPQEGSLVFIGYSDLDKIGLLKSVDGGENFAYDASTIAPISTTNCAAFDQLNNKMWVGCSNGYIYSYSLTTGEFDSSINIGEGNQVYDLQIRGSLRVAGLGTGIITPF